MALALEIVGLRFGRLTVTGFTRTEKGKYLSQCDCDCGASKNVQPSDLTRGRTSSCGCLHREMVQAMGRQGATHGCTKNRKPSSEYICWQAMLSRCQNKKHKFYHLYGGRGISVCQEWKDDFTRFLADMGPRPSRLHTIDRIKNDLGYSKNNCRWATKRQQVQNRDCALKATIDGVEMPIREAAAIFGISMKTVLSRIYTRKMSPEQAVSAPKYHRAVDAIDSLGRPSADDIAVAA